MWRGRSKQLLQPAGTFLSGHRALVVALGRPPENSPTARPHGGGFAFRWLPGRKALLLHLNRIRDGTVVAYYGKGSRRAQGPGETSIAAAVPTRGDRTVTVGRGRARCHGHTGP